MYITASKTAFQCKYFEKYFAKTERKKRSDK